MLRHLRTEWGGSNEMMLAFLRAEEPHLSSNDRQRLWAQYHAQVSHHALHFPDDAAQGLEHARMAAELDPLQTGQLLMAALRNEPAPRGTRAPLREQAAMIVQRFLNAHETRPQALIGTNAYVALGLWFQLFDHPLLTRVTAFLSRNAERGDEDAAVTLGRLATARKHEGLLDPTAALTRARDEGSTDAAQGLVEYLRAKPTAPRALIDAAAREGADRGNAELAAEVYRHFPTFQKQFGLHDRDRYRYPLLAAAAGGNDARVELATRLRRGEVELGDDGALRPMKGRPLQESMDYARHLLERAHEGNGRARELLKGNGTGWRGTRFPTWAVWVIAVVVIRAVLHLLGLGAS